MDKSEILNWLMDSDASIQFQTQRDLLGNHDVGLQQRIAKDPWASTILARQNPDTSWGDRFYQPKWISTHYTLLELKGLQLAPDHPQPIAAIQYILDTEVREDGGVGPGLSLSGSDACVAGMFLNYACYFGADERRLTPIVDFLLNQRLADGGFNCQLNRSGAHHSSVHSSLSILEGIQSFQANGYQYRLSDLQDAARTAWEFLLMHRLYKSDRTGEIIRKDFLTFSYPARWKYNVLRALDYWQDAALPWDDRLQDSFELLSDKQRPDGRWPKGAQHSGQHHLTMEPGRVPSRWNTLMALRVLKHHAFVRKAAA